MILGHESSGTVTEVGEGVKHLKAGDILHKQYILPQLKVVSMRRTECVAQPE